jgi:transcriptional regulatory protein RtcR
MQKVAFGFLGSKLDAMGGFSEKRQNAWRPTVSLALDKSLGISRLELWYSKQHLRLATQVKSDIEAHAPSPEVRLREVEIRDPWNFEEVYSFLYDFCNQYQFKSPQEEYYVHLTTGTHVAQICLFLLTESRHFPARLVQTSPRGESPSPALSIIDLDLSRYDKLAQRFEAKLASDLQILKAGINTNNPAFNAMIREIELVARSSTEPILLMGPTGAGKSQLAKQVYRLKQAQHRLEGAFVDINCATIRGEQAMSTLFGHAKGAFTGALSKRDGLLKKANRGLLFLDEIGELGLDEQAMLLRALEEKLFFPLGSDIEQSSDFQLIAGTNRNLLQQVQRGQFREDLLHRINTWSFTLPALRERPEDIEPNLEFELKKFEQRSGRRISFSAEAKAAYLIFARQAEACWSGNFRDLNASVVRMATLAPQGRITLENVRDECKRLTHSWNAPAQLAAQSHSPDAILEAAGIAAASIDLFDRPQLALVLQTLKTCSSIAEAGRRLFAVSRQERSQLNDSDRLRKYLARFGLDAKPLLGAR